ncbi:hypothetical protein AB0X56_00400 [Weissella paramesenteroides]|uniref:hypothetical protein n=1 Tax=Weissella paramesenteroides TaxID=1249 RepID=UPI003F217CE8
MKSKNYKVKAQMQNICAFTSFNKKLLDSRRVARQLSYQRAPTSSIPYISPILTQSLAAPGRKTGLIPER